MLVAFSCKQRSPCPSCAARRMCKQATPLTTPSAPSYASRAGDMFRLNAAKITQVAVYGLLAFETFTWADVEQALTRAFGRPARAGAVEEALLDLRLFGFAVEQEARFTWAIPLLRETLRASDPERADEQMVEELGDAPGTDGEA